MATQKLVLTDDEVTAIHDLLAELTRRHRSAEEAEFLNQATVFSHELPRRVRSAFNSFRLLEPSSAQLLVAGYPIDEERIGATPTHWKNRTTRALPEEMLLVLFGSLLGEVIGWATQQDGSIVHDIAPIQGHEDEQLGSGSGQLLWWHTEDAFHPFRGDYIAMMCLRNPDRVATTFADLEGIELSDRHRQLLFEPHYTIRPDESHLLKNKSERRSLDTELSASYNQIEEMNTRPEKIAVLSGDPGSPYVRIDPYFMDPAEDREAQEALDALIHGIDRKLGDLVLEAGDFCFIDNCKAVHGRRPFKARYDGNDRWLKRINIARDLRRSRSARHGAPEDRVISVF
jgi:Fe(II)/alpha-ketoglutarate-dependent arginine beta-hydroxylase